MPDLFVQLYQTLHYYYSKDLYYTDLKLENILYKMCRNYKNDIFVIGDIGSFGNIYDGVFIISNIIKYN